MKRVLCIWFPNWPLQRLLRAQPELKGRPVVLYETTRRGLRVLSCSRFALQRGVRVGMPVAEARGLFGTTHEEVAATAASTSTAANQSDASAAHFQQHAPAEDMEMLQQLAGWCHQFSPTVGWEQIAAPDSLLLDVTGCTHLFQGEASFVRQVVQAFRQQQWIVRLGLADTVGAAWAAAHFPRNRSGKPEIVPAAEQLQCLRDRPVEALRLPPAIWQTLVELDIRQIGQLQDLPRASLPSRLGGEVLLQLARLAGEQPEPIVPYREVPPTMAHREFEPPLRNFAALNQMLRELIEQILRELQLRQQGIQRLQIELQEPGRGDLCCAVGFLHPVNSPTYASQLVQTHLEQQQIPGEIAKVTVRAIATTPLNRRQEGLFFEATTREAQRQFVSFLERVSSRLGEQAVVKARLHPDAQPEHAFRWEAILAEANSASLPELDEGSLSGNFFTDFFTARPLWLKHTPQAISILAAVTEGPPIRFRWRGQTYTVVQSWGPERIVTGWWRVPAAQRDYYRIETDTGERFWLFRQLEDNRWFLQGIFA